MKIGLFFGTFNPVHVGHLMIAQAAVNETDLDRVWMMVSPQNPFKVKSNVLGEYDRLRMVELGVGENPQVQASNFEFTLPKPSYTIDTLKALAKSFPTYSFSLIMGEDNLEQLPKWKDFEHILSAYPIYCYPRQGSDGSAFANFPQIRVFKLSYLDISATTIREMLKAGKSVRYMVPDAVHEYLTLNKLYVD